MDTVVYRKDCIDAYSVCHIRLWLAACCEKGSRVHKPSSPIIASHTVRPM